MSIVRTRSFLPSEGELGGGGGGWLRRCGGVGGYNLKEGVTAVVIVLLLDQQPYSDWEGAQPPTLTIKGVRRLIGIFQRPAGRKTFTHV